MRAQENNTGTAGELPQEIKPIPINSIAFPDQITIQHILSFGVPRRRHFITVRHEPLEHPDYPPLSSIGGNTSLEYYPAEETMRRQFVALLSDQDPNFKDQLTAFGSEIFIDGVMPINSVKRSEWLMTQFFQYVETRSLREREEAVDRLQNIISDVMQSYKEKLAALYKECHSGGVDEPTADMKKLLESYRTLYRELCKFNDPNYGFSLDDTSLHAEYYKTEYVTKQFRSADERQEKYLHDHNLYQLNNNVRILLGEFNSKTLEEYLTAVSQLNNSNLKSASSKGVWQKYLWDANKSAYPIPGYTRMDLLVRELQEKQSDVSDGGCGIYQKLLKSLREFITDKFQTTPPEDISEVFLRNDLAQGIRDGLDPKTLKIKLDVKSIKNNNNKLSSSLDATEWSCCAQVVALAEASRLSSSSGAAAARSGSSISLSSIPSATAAEAAAALRLLSTSLPNLSFSSRTSPRTNTDTAVLSAASAAAITAGSAPVPLQKAPSFLDKLFSSNKDITIESLVKKISLSHKTLDKNAVYAKLIDSMAPLVDVGTLTKLTENDIKRLIIIDSAEGVEVFGKSISKDKVCGAISQVLQINFVDAGVIVNKAIGSKPRQIS